MDKEIIKKYILKKFPCITEIQEIGTDMFKIIIDNFYHYFAIHKNIIQDIIKIILEDIISKKFDVCEIKYLNNKYIIDCNNLVLEYSNRKLKVLMKKYKKEINKDIKELQEKLNEYIL